jgi:hypothetical protein
VRAALVDDAAPFLLFVQPHTDIKYKQPNRSQQQYIYDSTVAAS